MDTICSLRKLYPVTEIEVCLLSLANERCSLAHWTQIYTSLLAGALNSNPLISVSEMIGDMPCREELFEAETAQKFEQLLSLESAGSPSKSLADFIFLLLSDAYPGPEDESFSQITPNDLFIMISGKSCPVLQLEPILILFLALGLIVSVAKANCLTPTFSNALHRACARWKALWDIAVAKVEDPATQPGFAKYAIELWWFALIIIRVARSGDRTSDYMSGMAVDSLTIVNKFLSQYSGLGNLI